MSKNKSPVCETGPYSLTCFLHSKWLLSEGLFKLWCGLCYSFLFRTISYCRYCPWCEHFMSNLVNAEMQISQVYICHTWILKAEETMAGIIRLQNRNTMRLQYLEKIHFSHCVS